LIFFQKNIQLEKLNLLEKIVNDSKIKKKLELTKEEIDFYVFFSKGTSPNDNIDDKISSIHKNYFSTNIDKDNKKFASHIANLIAISIGSPPEKSHFYYKIFETINMCENIDKFIGKKK